MAMIDRLFQVMLDKHASALQLTTEDIPIIRVKDEFIELAEEPALPADMLMMLLQEICPASEWERFNSGGEAKFIYEIKGIARISANYFRDSKGPGATFQVKATPRKSSSPKSGGGRAGNEMDRLFHLMVEKGASDLHLTSGEPPILRIDGSMVKQDSESPISASRMNQLLQQICSQEDWDYFEKENDLDFAYEIEGLARFRSNYFRDLEGPGAVFRVIPSKILTAEQLGLPKSIMNLCYLTKGLVLVTGPTGSGKSTTLCAMIDYINRHRNDHIITIEDPVEFVHPNKKCLINQREIGIHTNSFKNALKAALREDPDIILVGEMRDLETVAIAIEMAETGHLVFGTLHTTTASSTVDRLIDQFPAGQQSQIRTMLAESLKGVVAQTLLKKIGGGRVAALEILICTQAVSSNIREGKTHQIPLAMQTGVKSGMVELNQALLKHVVEGRVEPQEAYMKAVHKDRLADEFRRAGIRFELPGTVEEEKPKVPAQANQARRATGRQSGLNYGRPGQRPQRPQGGDPRRGSSGGRPSPSKPPQKKKGWFG